MGKWIAILLGIVLLALGVWGIVAWWYSFLWQFVVSGLVVMAIIVGLGMIAFGYSEIRSAAEERKIAAEPAPPPPPPPPPPASGGESSGGGEQAPPAGTG